MICKKLKLSTWLNRQVTECKSISFNFKVYSKYSVFTANCHILIALNRFYSTGWVQIPIKDVRNRPIRTFMIQIAVISNHQNGRDTHMRQIRIHSPIEGRKYPLEECGKFTTQEFQQYSTIR